MPPSCSSSRWCPTPEQLMILEELYRSGIRTPSATQIQHITAQLSFYGKIEGKNVFYWFQNHKARDRQKLRRKITKELQQQQQQQHLLQLQNHNHFLNYFDYSPTSSAFHHHMPIPPTTFFPQGVEDMPSIVAWKMEMPIENEKSTMVYEENEYSSRAVVVKTLQLFPVTATNLKEECDKSKLFSSTTNFNHACNYQ